MQALNKKILYGFELIFSRIRLMDHSKRINYIMLGIIVLLLFQASTKILKITPDIIQMDSECVTEISFPLFEKYNGEIKNNIFMLPHGKKYKKILTNLIPERSVVLSDKFTAGCLTKMINIEPIYAMPGYPDLSRFTRFLLMHQLITKPIIVDNPQAFQEKTYLANIDFILLHKVHTNQIESSYPTLLPGYLNSTDILERIYEDEYLYLFKVSRENIYKKLISKYKGEEWRLLTQIQFNFPIHSGLIQNILDLNLDSAISFDAYKRESSFLKFNSKFEKEILQIILKVNSSFAEDLLEIFLTNPNGQIPFNIIKEEKNKILIQLKTPVSLNELKIEIRFDRQQDKYYKIYNMNVI